MSFKLPRQPRARLVSSSPSRRQSTLSSEDASQSSPHGHRLVPPSDVPKIRRGYGTKGHVQLHNNEVLAEPLGRVFVQRPALPRTLTATAIHPPELALDDPFVDAGDAEPSPIYVLGGDDPELRHQRQRRKRERQWTKWANETIPSLIQPYLQVLRESDNLCTLNRHSDVTLPTCLCERRSSIDVTCVFFERKLFYFPYV
jgi:hypothetical protein